MAGWAPSRHLAAGVLVAGLLAGGTATITSPGSTDVLAAAEPSTSHLVPVGPTRLADTRRADCGCERLDGSTITVDATGHADVPDDAVAVAITVTALPSDGPGHVTVYPEGQQRPTASTVNTRPDRVVANSAIVPVSDSGGIALYQHSPGDLVVDVTAAFVPAATSRSGRFVPLTPRRLADTRTPEPPAGPLAAGGAITVPLPHGVAADATAVVVNVTSVLDSAPGHLTARPSTSADATTSFLNLDGSGQVVAASVVVPVDDGGFSIESFGGGHVVVDIAGWFTGPSAADGDIGLFVPEGPTRLLDTRRQAGHIWQGGTIELASPVAGAAALVTNLTVVLPDRRGHVTAYPARTALPGTSSVNPAFRDHTVANLAITRVSTAGVAYRSHAGTELVVDLTGWFTGTPAATTTGPAPNEPPRSRVLLVGDSTLTALVLLPQTHVALQGFDAVIDAAACRRLVRTSCRSNVTGMIPSTVVEAILATPGTLDMVVVKAGFNDWFSDFRVEFDAVVNAVRAKGAHTIIWQTYNTANVSRSTARQAYAENNADLRMLVNEPAYADVLLADWAAYTSSRPDWFWDGTHLTPAGTWAQADYVSRWVAAAERRPCPQPWVLGAAVPDPCPAPEIVGPVPDPQGLY